MEDTVFYSPEEVQKVEDNISKIEDTFKYLVVCKENFNHNEEDAKNLTPELIEAFKNVAGACKDFYCSFDFYYNKYLKDK